MRQQNHACRFEEIFKTKLQASVASAAKTLRSQNRLRAKIRLFFNGLQVVHGRLLSVPNALNRMANAAKTVEARQQWCDLPVEQPSKFELVMNRKGSRHRISRSPGFDRPRRRGN